MSPLFFLLFIFYASSLRTESSLSLDPTNDLKPDPPAKESPAAASPPPRPSILCDVTVEHGLCLYGGEKVISPDASIEGVIARYTFDDGQYLDQTINQNHGIPSVPYPSGGPGRGGFGSSLWLKPNRWLQIEPSESTSALQDFSLTFWLYIYSDVDSTQEEIVILGKSKLGPAPKASDTSFLESDDTTTAKDLPAPLSDDQTPDTPAKAPPPPPPRRSYGGGEPAPSPKEDSPPAPAPAPASPPADSPPASKDTPPDATPAPATAPTTEQTVTDDKQTETVDFGLVYIPATQSLRVVSDTTQPRVLLNSRGRIRYGRWTHVTLVSTATRLNSGGFFQLYLNGVLDVVSKQLTGGGGWGSPSLPVYLGTTNPPSSPPPASTSSNELSNFLLDDVKIWSRPVTWLEVSADSFPSLGGIETYYTKLGCDVAGCTCQQAIDACQQNSGHSATKLHYHLCNENELYAGAYQVARTMGWTEWDTKLWILHPEGGCVGADEEEMRLALCCLV